MFEFDCLLTAMMVKWPHAQTFVAIKILESQIYGKCSHQHSHKNFYIFIGTGSDVLDVSLKDCCFGVEIYY